MSVELAALYAEVQNVILSAELGSGSGETIDISEVAAVVDFCDLYRQFSSLFGTYLEDKRCYNNDGSDDPYDILDFDRSDIIQYNQTFNTYCQ